MDFKIHPRLLDDCHVLGRLNLSHALLHKNAVIPWFILVPAVAVIELHEMIRDQRQALMDEADLVAGFVVDEFEIDKLNIAAIGNLVPQLHMHVIGRNKRDPCWPDVVWGNLTVTAAYSSQRIEEIRSAMRDKIGLD